MSKLEWLLLGFILALIATHANADDYSIRFGPGIVNSQLTGATKSFGLRAESELEWWGLNSAYELGGYTDSRAGQSAAAFVKAQLGVKPGMDAGLFGKAFVGPCLISATDSTLGGPFQFCEDVGVGIRDSRTFIDIDYQHISSAGLESPNQGRDSLLFEAGVRF